MSVYEHPKIYPTLASAPLDETGFNKQRALTFLNTIDQMEKAITKKCYKLKKQVNRFGEASAGCSLLSVLTAGSTIATTVTIVGIPISVAIGTLSIACSGVSVITNKVGKAKAKKRDKYVKMLSEIHKTKASYEHAFSRSLNDGISLDEFTQLQTIYVNLLKSVNTKVFRTETYVNDLKQQDFLAQVANIITKKS
jgi:hypothetical protein